MALDPNASHLLAAITTVFFILTSGFLLQRIRPFSQETLTQLTRLVIDFLLPLYLFYATASSTPPSTAAAPIVFIAGLSTPLLSLALAMIAGRIAHASAALAPSFRFAAMVGNTSFIGIPLCASLFDSGSVVYAVLYDFGTSFIIFTVGVWVLLGGGKTNWRALIANPLIITVLAGLAWSWLGWDFPTWVDQPLHTLSNAAVPLALLVVGVQLGALNTTAKGHWGLVGWLAAIRLALTPLLVAALLHLLHLDEVIAGVIVVQAGMPVGLITAILTARNNLDFNLPAAAILWSTLGLALTLPVILYFLL